MSNRLLAAGTNLIDVNFRGVPGYVGAIVLDTGMGLVLVDPGPESTIRALNKGLELLAADLHDVTAILVTHIHLDHAGSVGSILAVNPEITVYVHRSGAHHLTNPTRLLASAARLYGERMEELWGKIEPVPETRLVALEGGERLSWGSRKIRVEYTPGHAKHHVSYLDETSGLCFVGDTAGVVLSGGRIVLPVTPPADIDLVKWRETTNAIRKLRPARLVHTHFGLSDDPVAHLARHLGMLEEWADRVKASLVDTNSDQVRAREFAARIAAEIGGDDQGVAALELALSGLTDSWLGLAQYWRRASG